MFYIFKIETRGQFFLAKIRLTNQRLFQNLFISCYRITYISKEPRKKRFVLKRVEISLNFTPLVI